MIHRSLFITSILLACAFTSPAQLGCTDPYATNYNPTATINDGSCIYPVTHDTLALRTTLPVTTLNENSGLAWSDGKLWAHDDSGNPATLFSIDTTDGNVIQTVFVDNYPNVDWEDITADSSYLYIADVGNNTGDRTDLKILKIAKADIDTATGGHVNAQAISFSYADQTNFTPTQLTNFDCEALISIGDSLYIFTKDRLDNKTRVYKMPKVPGTYSLSPYTTFNVSGLITAASYDPVNREIVLLGYTLLKTNSFLWFLNDYTGDMFFSGNKRRIEIGDNTEWQTEAVEFISPGRFFVSNESATVAASLFIGTKDWPTELSVANKTPDPAIKVYPIPVVNTLYVDNLTEKAGYCIIDILGKQVANGTLSPEHNNVSFTTLSSGIYMLEVLSPGGVRTLQKIVKE